MMQNKQYILILVALLVLGGLGYYFVSNSSDETSTMERSTGDGMMEKSPSLPTPTPTDVMKPEMMTEAPEGAVQYVITSGSAKYIAQKGWVSKPTEAVEGITTEVMGDGWLNPETGALELKASVDLAKLESDSEGRDKDIAGRFEDTTAMLALELESSDITLEEEFSLDLPVMLTINGVEKEVVFTVTGLVTEESFNAQGTTTVLMSDFGFEAPSALGLYEVKDEFEMAFDVEGEVL